jgi:hypothetical protein
MVWPMALMLWFNSWLMLEFQKKLIALKCSILCINIQESFQDLIEQWGKWLALIIQEASPIFITQTNNNFLAKIILVLFPLGILKIRDLPILAHWTLVDSIMIMSVTKEVKNGAA